MYVERKLVTCHICIKCMWNESLCAWNTEITFRGVARIFKEGGGGGGVGSSIDKKGQCQCLNHETTVNCLYRKHKD